MGTTPYVFNYTTWITLFPELSGVSSAQATLYFGLATGFVRNDGRGPICDPNIQAELLNLITAHIAKIFSQQTNGTPTTGGTETASLVGRISGATEGSVSVQTEYPGQSPSAAWWDQTTYGAMAWVLMKPYRTFRYFGNPKRRVYNPPRWGFGVGI